MNDWLYQVHSAVIALALLASMALALSLGQRLGLRQREGVSEALRSHVAAIQASMLGILALMLGFTFSLALQRYDSRSEALVAEANAIGTAWLRADLLPPTGREAARTALRTYAGLRANASAASLTDARQRDPLLAQMAAQQSQLWSLAAQSARAAPEALTAALFVQSVNDAFDSAARHEAALARHVPELVLALLFATFVLTCGVVGYAAGVSGHATSRVTHIMAVLIVVLVFIIIDLDRPRRGLIQVSQKSLQDLQVQMQADAPVPPQRP